MLEQSRIDASDAAPTLVAVEPLVRRVVERAEGPSSAIVLNYRSSIPVIRGRESDLETALLNLLDNAQRYSPPGVPVVVEVEGRPGDAELVLSIQDQGPGIAPEHLPRIFERFFSTDTERDGTGLGLSIVKSVVDAQGGRISVQPAEPSGTGTRITLRLPLNLRAEASSGSRRRPFPFYRSRRAPPQA